MWVASWMVAGNKTLGPDRAASSRQLYNPCIHFLHCNLSSIHCLQLQPPPLLCKDSVMMVANQSVPWLIDK